MSLISKPLSKNDEIRVIAPSKSLIIISDEVKKYALNRLKKIGYKVSISKNAYKYDEDFMCASVEERISDLHDAFLDNKVSGIFTAIGGYNANQILPYIDYEIIKKHPKMMCGFSDITVLLNAIYVKTGLITYYGPHFSSFGMIQGFEYTQKYFELAISGKEYVINNSKEYSDDEWFINQNKRKFFKNNGIKPINYGQANGTIIGGNLSSFNLLIGTEYMPNDDKIILFLEDDYKSGVDFMQEFDRNLESLLQTSFFERVCGIVIGRAQINCDMTDGKWKKIINRKNINIPVIINVDFGHTTPICTFPIGGKCQIISSKNRAEIKIYGR